MQIDTAKVAVLIDRVERLLAESTEMRKDLGDIRVSLGKIEQLPLEVAQLKIKVETLEAHVNRHNFITKLSATVLLLCVSLIGWGWREGKALYGADVLADRRLLLVEYKLGIPQPEKEGDKK